MKETKYREVEKLKPTRSLKWDKSKRGWVQDMDTPLIYKVHTVSRTSCHNIIDCDSPEKAEKVYLKKLKTLIK